MQNEVRARIFFVQRIKTVRSNIYEIRYSIKIELKIFIELDHG